MFRTFILVACLFLMFSSPVAVFAGPPTTAAMLALKTDGLAQFCATRLNLNNTQAAMLRYYLQDQIRSLRMEVEGGALSAQAMPATGRQRLNEMVAKLLTPQQLADYQTLMASTEAAPLLRGLALSAN